MILQLFARSKLKTINGKIIKRFELLGVQTEYEHICKSASSCTFNV